MMNINCSARPGEEGRGMGAEEERETQFGCLWRSGKRGRGVESQGGKGQQL